MESIFNELFSRVNISKMQLSKDLDISRSFIQRVISGEKPMSEKMYHSMLSLEYIPDDIKRKISACFFQNKFGFSQYELITEYLKYAEKFNTNEEYKCSHVFEDLSNFDIIKGKDEICDAAFSIIQSGEPTYTNYPFFFQKLDNALFFAANENFYHLAALPMELTKFAIQIYWSILRWGLKKIITRVSRSICFKGLYPYLIISGEKVLLINSDCTKAMFISNNDIVEAYKEEFMRLYDESKPAFKIIYNEPDLLAAPALDLLNGTKIKTIETSICPACIYDYESLDAIARTDLPPELREGLIRTFLAYYNCAQKINSDSLVTESAFEKYALDGDMVTVTQKYVNKCPHQIRAKIFDGLLNNTDYPNFKIIKKEHKLPQGFVCDMTDNIIITHFYFENIPGNPYEIFMRIPCDYYADLNCFTANLFDYLSSPDFTMSELQKKYFLSQLKIRCENSYYDNI